MCANAFLLKNAGKSIDFYLTAAVLTFVWHAPAVSTNRCVYFMLIMVQCTKKYFYGNNSQVIKINCSRLWRIM
jgi:hypothetical protein